MKFPALFKFGVKNSGSHLRKGSYIHLTLKIDLKIKIDGTVKCSPRSWSTFVRTIWYIDRFVVEKTKMDVYKQFSVVENENTSILAKSVGTSFLLSNSKVGYWRLFLSSLPFLELREENFTYCGCIDAKTVARQSHELITFLKYHVPLRLFFTFFNIEKILSTRVFKLLLYTIVPSCFDF